MQKAINLYTISRINNFQDFVACEKHLSQRDTPIQMQSHEMISLKTLVDDLLKLNCAPINLDGFFLSYKIPQIGKEFDLLKLTDTTCLNIELKSEPVNSKKVQAQLLKNKHYLNHLPQRKILFTYITNTKQCFRLHNNTVTNCSLEELLMCLLQISTHYKKTLEGVFRPTDYLVSPLNTPEKFLSEQYFLTLQQDEIATKIDHLCRTASKYFVSITGGPGTGKTLLLYELAKRLSAIGRVLVVHCGTLSTGHAILNSKLSSVDILPAKQITEDFKLALYKFILVDESHRAYNTLFVRIINSTMYNHQVCIFAFDSKQTLSKAEIKRDLESKINALTPLKKFTLSEKIRTNAQMSSFIACLSNLNQPTKYVYDNVDLLYAETPAEAVKILTLYKTKNFTFINFTKSIYVSSPYAKFDLVTTYNTHSVIGQEFDNVIMVLDDSFYYDEQTKQLKAVVHPNPDYLYLKLLYQGITRVREHLALVILSNEPLFRNILSILE